MSIFSRNNGNQNNKPIEKAEPRHIVEPGKPDPRKERLNGEEKTNADVVRNIGVSQQRLEEIKQKMLKSEAEENRDALDDEQKT